MMENYEHLHSVMFYSKPNPYHGVDHVAEIKHKGLSSSRTIEYPDQLLLELFVKNQFSQWDDQW